MKAAKTSAAAERARKAVTVMRLRAERMTAQRQSNSHLTGPGRGRCSLCRRRRGQLGTRSSSAIWIRRSRTHHQSLYLCRRRPSCPWTCRRAPHWRPSSGPPSIPPAKILTSRQQSQQSTNLHSNPHLATSQTAHRCPPTKTPPTSCRPPGSSVAASRRQSQTRHWSAGRH